MPARARRHAARTAGALSLAAAGALVTAARADDSCTIRVSPTGAGSAWLRAAADAQRAIDDTAPAVRDCRRVDVEVGGEGATLTFVTRDGRTATRTLPAPSALRPVVEGLLVTLPLSAPRPPTAAVASAPIGSASIAEVASATPPRTAPSARAPRVRAPTRAVSSASSVSSVSTVTSAPPAEPSGASTDPPPHLMVAATAGVRLGTPHDFLGPAFGLDGSFAMARWDLGLFGLWEPSNAEHDAKAASGASLSTLGAGVHAGRREPLGPLQLLYAATATVVRIAASADTFASETVTDTRFGALVGIAAPQGSSYRFRLQLQGDYNPVRHGQAFLSGLPRWSFGLLVGLETELL